jgi:hypothetical protein
VFNLRPRERAHFVNVSLSWQGPAQGFCRVASRHGHGAALQGRFPNLLNSLNVLAEVWWLCPASTWKWLLRGVDGVMLEDARVRL